MAKPPGFTIVVDLGWIGLWLLVCTSSGFRWLKESLGAVGRTAFSNYILQTLIATTLFYGHGFGLFGSVSRVGQIFICVAIWVVQLAIAPLWLRHFEYGPLEWLWKVVDLRAEDADAHPQRCRTRWLMRDDATDP